MHHEALKGRLTIALVYASGLGTGLTYTMGQWEEIVLWLIVSAIAVVLMTLRDKVLFQFAVKPIEKEKEYLLQVKPE